MSKKSADATPASAVPTSIVPANNAFAQRFIAAARASAATNVEPRIEPKALVEAARTLINIPTTAAALTAALAAGEFDFALLAGLGWVAEQLDKATQPTVADRRKTKLLTPAQKSLVADARRRVQKDLEAIYAVARVTGRLADARALGLAGSVGKSPGSVYAAYQTLLAQAEQNEALLDDAGITAAKRRARAATLQQLGEIGTAKVQSKQKKGEIGRGIKELTLAAECGFGFYRARATSALEDDSSSLPTALGYIPRATEKRNQPAAEDEIEDDETEEGEGTGAANPADDKEKAAAEKKEQKPS